MLDSCGGGQRCYLARRCAVSVTTGRRGAKDGTGGFGIINRLQNRVDRIVRPCRRFLPPVSGPVIDLFARRWILPVERFVVDGA